MWMYFVRCGWKAPYFKGGCLLLIGFWVFSLIVFSPFLKLLLTNYSYSLASV